MKKLLLCLVVFASLLVFGTSAMAATGLEDVCTGEAANSPVCQERAGAGQNPLVGPSGIITRATQVVVYVAGIAAVIMVIIGGIRYITSGGDSNSINSAKNTILYAIIGIVVAVIGQALVSFVLVELN